MDLAKFYFEAWNRRLIELGFHLMRGDMSNKEYEERLDTLLMLWDHHKAALKTTLEIDVDELAKELKDFE